jgi:hypothetical protein
VKRHLTSFPYLHSQKDHFEVISKDTNRTTTNLTMKLNRLIQVGAFISLEWLHSTAAIELNETIVKIPSNITLRAGVLLAPPFQVCV